MNSGLPLACSASEPLGVGDEAPRGWNTAPSRVNYGAVLAQACIAYQFTFGPSEASDETGK